MNNRIILVVGESGSGKDTLVDTVCEQYGYKKLISYTTRPQRNTNKDLQSHYFISTDELRNLKDIVAYTEFNGYEYCATAEQVDNADFYIIDCEGVKYFKAHYKGNKEIVTVHINVPKVDRFLRMRKRDGTMKAMERIKHDNVAFAEVDNMCDITIDNTDSNINVTVEKLKEIMEGDFSE